MRLCFGTFTKVLNLCKPASKALSERKLTNALLLTISNAYEINEINGVDSRRLLNCEQSLPSSVINSARNLISENNTQSFISQFHSIIFDSGYIKTDDETLQVIHSVMLDIIERDTTIAYDTTVDLINDISKKEILKYRRDNIPDFLPGIFLFIVISVENRLTTDIESNDVAEVKTITETYIKNFFNASIYEQIPSKINLPDKLSPEKAFDNKNKKSGSGKFNPVEANQANISGNENVVPSDNIKSGDNKTIIQVDHIAAGGIQNIFSGNTISNLYL